jgi:ribosomal protein L37AE/L43A
MAAGEPSNGVCHECGNALTRNEHGTWRCKGCEGRRFDTTWTYDDDGLSGEES